MYAYIKSLISGGSLRKCGRTGPSNEEEERAEGGSVGVGRGYGFWAYSWRARK